MPGLSPSSSTESIWLYQEKPQYERKCDGCQEMLHWCWSTNKKGNFLGHWFTVVSARHALNLCSHCVMVLFSALLQPPDVRASSGLLGLHMTLLMQVSLDLLTSQALVLVKQWPQATRYVGHSYEYHIADIVHSSLLSLCMTKQWLQATRYARHTYEYCVADIVRSSLPGLHMTSLVQASLDLLMSQVLVLVKQWLRATRYVGHSYGYRIADIVHSSLLFLMLP